MKMQSSEILSNHYLTILTKMLGEKGTEARTVSDVFTNLPLLATTTISFGQEVKYLPLSLKKIIAKTLDPESRLEYEVVDKSKTELAVEAKFYWGNDEKYTGYGFCRRSLTDLVIGQCDASKLETNFESLVKGAAASRALTDAGIGLEFYCDEFDTLLSSMEDTEASDMVGEKSTKSKAEFEAKVPIVPSNIDRKKRHHTEAPSKGPSPDDSSPFPKKIQEEPTEETLSKEPDELSKAKATVCDVGDFSGQTLGEIYEKNPRLLVKIARNPESECKDAAKVIVISDGRYSQYVQ